MKRTEKDSARIGLALSGGGMRAAIFHLGVLRYLAEKNLLESVHYVSTVSGASLLIGLLLNRSHHQWPSSSSFLLQVHPQIRKTFLASNLQIAYAGRLALPWNWPRFPSRANVLADAIRAEWGINSTLSDLPKMPTWAINCTTVETGKRWRFKDGTMGDYMLGYAQAPEFPLASAIAASAAFPGGVSPLRFRTVGYDWYTYESWKGRKTVPSNAMNKLPVLHLADGGIYDNLGLEPLFDQSQGELKPDSGCNCVVVSDAGRPLGVRGNGALARWVGFSTRTVDIIHSQARALRIRYWVSFIRSTPGAGVLIDITMTPGEELRRAESYGVRVPESLTAESFLTDDECRVVARYPTTLWKPEIGDFERVETLGYQLARTQFSLYANHLVAH